MPQKRTSTGGGKDAKVAKMAVKPATCPVTDSVVEWPLGKKYIERVQEPMSNHTSSRGLRLQQEVIPKGGVHAYIAQEFDSEASPMLLLRVALEEKLMEFARFIDGILPPEASL